MNRPGFHVIGSKIVAEFLAHRHQETIDIVKSAYCWHAAGLSANPESYFLRFADKPEARIIALPAYLGAKVNKAGLKWISSFPANRQLGLPRASAVLILNDYETGFPFACLEGSLISANRTAASAVLAAELLSPSGRNADRVVVVGAGLIASHILDYFASTGWRFGHISIIDLNKEASQRLARWCENHFDAVIDIQCEKPDVLHSADLIIFATTAQIPHIEGEPFHANPTVLHISLRDLAPSVILSAQNIVDDIEHCLRERTSSHLTELATGNRNFINGTLADVITGKLVVDLQRPRIFSPFGLGILDIAVGWKVYQDAVSNNSGIKVPDFFERI